MSASLPDPLDTLQAELEQELRNEQVRQHIPEAMRIVDAKGRPKIEIEALPVEILLRDTRAALEALLPEPLATVRAREAAQRSLVLELLA